MKKLFLATLMVICFFYCNGQPLSGTIVIPNENYPTLYSIIEALNNNGVGDGGVEIIINPGIGGYYEIAPAGGYVITASGSENSPIIINGNWANIVAYTPQQIGSINDAIFKIVGGDYITIKKFILNENPSNTEFSYIETNNATEFGVAIFYSDNENGPQHITIDSNLISLNIDYPNTFGIYANSMHDPIEVTTLNEITNYYGSFSYLNITNNNIQNVNIGIALIGATNPNFMSKFITIENNNINFGKSNLISNYVSLVPVASGIQLINVLNTDVKNNSIISDSSVTSGSIRGILYRNTATEQYNLLSYLNISDNSIQLTNANNNLIRGISIEVVNNNFQLSPVNLSIRNNVINKLNFTTNSTANVAGIYIYKGFVNTNISLNNISINTNTSTEEYVAGIYFESSLPHNSVLKVDSNNISIKNANGSYYVFGYFSDGISPSSVIKYIRYNTFSNFQVSSQTSLTCIRETDGDINNKPIKYIQDNEFAYITGGDATLIIINLNYGVHEVSNNQIKDITSNGNINCIIGGGNGTTLTQINNNLIENISSTNGNIIGILLSAIATNSEIKCFNNVLRNIFTLSNQSDKTVSAISVSNGANVFIYNNMIYELYAPNSNNTLAIGAINLLGISTTVVKVYHNTIFLDASSNGENFGSTCITLNSPDVELSNNIIVNNSIANGSGYSLLIRSFINNLSNYNVNSNNNIFFIDTLEAKNYFYYDGINFKKSFYEFKSYVVPREVNSLFELPPFENVSISPYDLHINNTVQTFVESNGKLIELVNHDIDNEYRFGHQQYNGTGYAPDIGADEIEGIPKFTCQNIYLGNTITELNEVCLNSFINITVENVPSGTGIIYQWKKSYDNFAYEDIPNETNPILKYNFTDTNDVYFKCLAICLGDGSEAESEPILISLKNKIFYTKGDTLCGPNKATLIAYSTENANIAWFSSLESNVPIFIGDTFITDILNMDTTFYVRAQTSENYDLQVGNGSYNSSSFESPFFHFYGGKKSQYLIRKEELLNLGLKNGDFITSLGIEVVSAASIAYKDFVLKIGHTLLNSLTTDYFVNNLNEVYNNSDLTLTSGINVFQFNHPFIWDGNSNIVIEFCWSNNNSGGESSSVKYDNYPFIAQSYYRADNLPASILCDVHVPNAIMYARPKFIFNINSICYGTKVPVNVKIHPSQPIVISNDTTICNNTILDVKVLNGIEYYSTFNWYSESPIYLDPETTIPYNGENTTQVYFKGNNQGIHKIVCFAYDSLTNCGSIDTVNILVLPSTIHIQSDKKFICEQGSAFLTLPNIDYGTAKIKWYFSEEDLEFVYIPNYHLTFYETTLMFDTMYFKAEIVIDDSVCLADSIMIPAALPEIINLPDVVRCGQGSVTFNAVLNNIQFNVAWFNDTTLMPVHFGNSYTTPPLNDTTSYFAQPFYIIDTFFVGNINPTNFIISSNNYMSFSTTENVIIRSIEVYPAISGDLVVSLYDQNNQLITQKSFNIMPSEVSQVIPKKLSLDFLIPAGVNNWKLAHNINLNVATGTFIYDTTNVFKITGNDVDGENISIGSRYYYFNWEISTICVGNVKEVKAIITPAPEVNIIASSDSICEGETIQLIAQSENSNYQYFWYSGTNPSTGDTVYAQPIQTTFYIVSATDPDGCNNTAQIKINVTPIPNIVVNANPYSVYCTDTVFLIASPIFSNYTILSESFNNTEHSFLTFNNSYGGDPSASSWTIKPSGYTYGGVTFISNDTSSFIISNSYAQGYGSTTHTQLISDTLDALLFDSLKIRFYHYYRHFNSQALVKVYYNNDWHTLVSYTSSQGSENDFKYVQLNIPNEYFSNNMRIMFEYIANWGWYWAIDNIEIIGYKQNTIEWYSLPVGFHSNQFVTYDTPLFSKTYIAKITTPEGCFAQDSIEVLVNNLQPPLLEVNNYCGYSEIIATNYFGTIYWSTGDSSVNSVITSNSENIFAYYETELCKSDTAIVFADPKIIPLPPYVDTIHSCFGQVVPPFIAVSDFNVEWYSDSLLLHQIAQGNTYQPQIFEPGVYQYYVIAVNEECTSEPNTAVAIIHQLPTVSVYNDGNILYSNVTSETPVTYQWYTNQGIISGATADTLVIDHSDYYYVAVTDIYGCSSFSDPIYVEYLLFSTILSNNIIVFPNPSKGIFYILNPYQKVLYCKLVNSFGKIILEKIIDNQINMIDITNVDSGLYQLILIFENMSYTFKLIKE